ncbi:MAG: hypothetical protein LBV79_10500 [Candidatus Adiutrix sp.]|jgi:3-hydroxymyristoyl/3-hydroxydecanoyl-(acyl carrier protein) dehydratase|nr:hypothetical protein [Candidatus Adiutrix sp.]
MRQQIAAAALGPPEKTAPPSTAFLKAAEVWRRDYLPAEDFAGFRGHFEGQPVLPALAQVFMAQDTAQTLAGHPLTLAAVTQAKFLSPVVPGLTLSVYAQAPDQGGEWRLHLTASGDGIPAVDAAFLRLKFKEELDV